MSTLGLYFHTVRHLRPTQIMARLWFRLHRPRVDTRGAPALRSMPRLYANAISPAPTLVAPQTFRFLNLERRCSTAADWHPPDAEKLWIYNLHYFDDLNAEAAASRSTWHEVLLARWVAENPPGRGDAWEPYPTSRRIVNWVKWAARGNVLPAQARDSLAVQTRWLTRRLEYHILGNHLFANAKALLHAGLYFDGPEAERWRARGLAIIARELREQVLADGGHFELSTMYHAAILEDLLDLINVQSAYGLQPPDAWVAAATRMQRWLRVMSHPDGNIAFFNDSAFGIAPNGAELEEYLVRLGLSAPACPPDAVITLGASGYVRVCAGRAYLLCDCGSLGPDYLPGHAHADTLSFELSLSGQRVFVNSGTSQYGLTSERQRERGTAAHNTVVVNGQNSSEVWGGFRVARRARATLHSVQPVAPAIVEASHDGYCRLPGRNEHRRRWTLDDDSLRIQDQVSGYCQSAEAFFHLHPEVKAKIRDGVALELSCPGAGLVRMTFDGAAGVEVRTGAWHPKFGIAVDNRCIVARFGKTSLTTRISWTQG